MALPDRKMAKNKLYDLNLKLLTPLTELDSLTDLFSFFTSFDKSLGRQVHKWWNELLTKDSLIIKQIKKNILLLDESVRFRKIDTASYLGYLDLIKWNVRHGCEMNYNTGIIAIDGEQFKVLKWLILNGCEGDEEMYCVAAGGGYLKILKWLGKKNVIPEWGSSRICEEAAAGGFLEVLKWCRDNYCDWSKETCSNAAVNGHLDVLIWARANGCHWDEYVCLFSQDQPHLKIRIKHNIQNYIHSLPIEESPCNCPRVQVQD
jgi:hypothetical protein